MSAKTILLQEGETTIKESDLIILLEKVETYEAENKVLAKTLKGALKLIGLIDPATNNVYEDIANKTRSPLPTIIKGISKTSLTLVKLTAMGKKKEGEREMHEKFGFIQDFLPLMMKLDEKYKDTKES